MQAERRQKTGRDTAPCSKSKVNRYSTYAYILYLSSSRYYSRLVHAHSRRKRRRLYCYQTPTHFDILDRYFCCHSAKSRCIEGETREHICPKLQGIRLQDTLPQGPLLQRQTDKSHTRRRLRSKTISPLHESDSSARASVMVSLLPLVALAYHLSACET